MPLFEFSCRGCRERFETLVMGGRTPLCPKCGSADLEKLYSSFATSAAGRDSGGAAPSAPRFT